MNVSFKFCCSVAWKRVAEQLVTNRTINLLNLLNPLPKRHWEFTILQLTCVAPVHLSHLFYQFALPNNSRKCGTDFICVCFHCRNIKLIYFLPRRGQIAVFASTAPWKYWLWTATWLAWFGSQTQYFETQRRQRLTGSPLPTNSSAYGMMARSCTLWGEHSVTCSDENFSYLCCGSSKFQWYLCSPLLCSSWCLPDHVWQIWNIQV